MSIEMPQKQNVARLVYLLIAKLLLAACLSNVGQTQHALCNGGRGGRRGEQEEEEKEDSSDAANSPGKAAACWLRLAAT